jgi:phosphopantothenoylcysteine decarboxylase
VLHIELRRLASALLIAPLSANTLAKIANGMCDNLLTSVVRCWDLKSGKKPFIVAPAMNTMMYDHPITDMQLKFLADNLKIKVLPTAYKVLMCGDEGLGAMIDTATIVKEVLEQI